MRVNLNADMGESHGRFRIGDDAATAVRKALAEAGIETAPLPETFN